MRTQGAHVSLYGIYEISKLLNEPARLEITLARVLRVLASFLDMRHGLIALLDDHGLPETVVGSGWSEASARHHFAELPERAIGRIVVTQMPVVVENAKDDALFEGVHVSAWNELEGDITFVGVPVKDRGRVIGTLTIDREHQPGTDREFRLDDDVRFLTMIANLLGQTVRLQRFMVRDRERLLEDQRRLEKALEHTAHDMASPSGIVGDSEAIRRVLDKVRVVARTSSTVVLRGESGTGKELFARAIHDLSPRRDRPFVTLNCAALPETVLESELFGHEKGSFTGATAQRKGRFELADGGTLFLDEIGEISAAFQAKLLRVLQLGEFDRVGGTSTNKVDVRIIAATNRNLEHAVARGEFRADLYYRINVVPIVLPPLRERPDDIPLLAREFLARFNRENDAALELTEPAVAVLASCCFPGNVRELENCVRRTATLARGTRIAASDFACRNDQCLSAVLWKSGAETALGTDFVPLPVTSGPRRASSRPPAAPASPAQASADTDADLDPDAHDAIIALPGGAGPDSDKSDRERLIEVMESTGWVQAKAARVLGLTPRQVGYALRKYDIPIKKF